MSSDFVSGNRLLLLDLLRLLTCDSHGITPMHDISVSCTGVTEGNVDVSLSSIVRTKESLIYRYPLSPHVPLPNRRLFRKEKNGVFDSVGQQKNISVTDVPT